MKRIPFVAGNWKMNTSMEEAVSLVRDMLEPLNNIENIEVAIFPPSIYIPALYNLLSSSRIALGAQNMCCAEKGAFTGEVSAMMIRPYCKYVIIGHSERRRIFTESNEMICKKVSRAIGSGLTPILCVGENLDQREAGQATETVVSQLEGSLDQIRDIHKCIIAYEPVWAIGTGVNAGISQVCEIMQAIRETVATMYGIKAVEKVRLLYGGSVTAENAAEYFRQPVIDGALVGGASLKADQFVSIAQQAARIRG